MIGYVYRLTLSPNRDAEASVHRRGGEDRGDLRFVAGIGKGARQKIFQLNRQLHGWPKPQRLNKLANSGKLNARA